MKKQHLIASFLAVAVLTVALIFALTGCNDIAGDDTVKYKVTVEGDHTSYCEVGQSYSAGEEVSVKLPTITEHYYTLYVNGEEAQWDRDRSDMEYTYFTFIMPECDVTVKIEGHSVDIPEAPEE